MLASDSERTEITHPLRNETSRAKTRNYGKSAEISCLITYKPSHMDGHTLLNRSCNVLCSNIYHGMDHLAVVSETCATQSKSDMVRL